MTRLEQLLLFVLDKVAFDFEIASNASPRHLDSGVFQLLSEEFFYRPAHFLISEDFLLFLLLSQHRVSDFRVVENGFDTLQR